MSRSSLRAIRRRALRRVRVGVWRRKFERIHEQMGQVIADAFVASADVLSRPLEALRQTLLACVREMVLRPIVRQHVENITSGGTPAGNFNQHGDADDAPP